MHTLIFFFGEISITIKKSSIQIFIGFCESVVDFEEIEVRFCENFLVFGTKFVDTLLIDIWEDICQDGFYYFGVYVSTLLDL